MKLTRTAPAVAVAVFALAVAGWWWTRSDAPATGAPTAETLASAPAAPQAAPDGAEVALQPDMTLGNPDALVRVVEYASFTCPHCANFHIGPFQQLRAQFIDTGLVHYTVREVFFDRYGLWAAMVARCDGAQRFHGVKEMLFRNQRQWLTGDSAAAVAENLRRIGRQAGMDAEQVNACMEDAAMALSLTATFQAHAEADNIRATPTFMINGTQYANMPWSEFERVLNGYLGN